MGSSLVPLEKLSIRQKSIGLLPTQTSTRIVNFPKLKRENTGLDEICAKDGLKKGEMTVKSSPF